MPEADASATPAETSTPSDAPSEREKWEAEQKYKTRELDLKARELDVRVTESRRARWTNPLVLAILGAMLAGLTNVGATFYSSYLQRETDGLKNKQEQQRESERAESQLALEVIKTGDPDKAATNLKFLVDTKLITVPEKREAILLYVKNREKGTGAALAATSNPYMSAADNIFATLFADRVTCDIQGRDVTPDAVYNVLKAAFSAAQATITSPDTRYDMVTFSSQHKAGSVTNRLDHVISRAADGHIILRSTTVIEPLTSFPVRGSALFITPVTDWAMPLIKGALEKLSGANACKPDLSRASTAIGDYLISK